MQHQYLVSRVPVVPERIMKNKNKAKEQAVDEYKTILNLCIAYRTD